MTDTNKAGPLPDEKILTLRKPIKLSDRVIGSITLREPTARQIEQVSKRAETSSQGSNILLIALVSDLTEGEIGMMGMRDFTEAMEYVGSFLGSAQETGQ